MAGLKGSMAGFMLVVVCLAVVPSVNGACTFQSQCYPGRCLLGQCDCPEGYRDSGSSCSANQCSPKCKNGGTCTSRGGCDCAPGYSGSYCQFSSTSGGNTGIEFVIGCVVCIFFIICCIISIVICVTRRHVTPTNPDAPPPYVASTNVESSKPPPYTSNHINSPVASSVEGAPTSQPLPPEFIPIEGDLPPEYLPPPESKLEMLPLHGVPSINLDASSDPPTSTADLSMSEHHPLAGSDSEARPVQGAPPTDVNAPPPCVPSAHLQSANSAPCTSDLNSCFIPTSVEDTPTPWPLLPESRLPIPNDEHVELEYLPPPGSSV